VKRGSAPLVDWPRKERLIAQAFSAQSVSEGSKAPKINKWASNVIVEIEMAESTPRPMSISKKVLKHLGLAYVPELTQDKSGQKKLVVPRYFTLREKMATVLSSTAPTPEKLEDDVADLAIKDRPIQVSRSVDNIKLNPLEEQTTTLAERKRDIPGVPSASEKTPAPHGHGNDTSDSSSTLSDTTKVSFTDYIMSNCPHIAQPYFTRPLLLPSMSLEEVAGFSGRFTKKIKTVLKWERYASSL
jgi:hypothetical protein